jgi:hypothetical protein
MVTGYILLCTALYEKLNDDDRYRQKGSLNFRITENAQYQHDSNSLFDALMDNWDQCSYCLYPCEVRSTLCSNYANRGLHVVLAELDLHTL